MQGKLNIILDIDNTLLEYMVKDAPWKDLPEAEKKKYDFYQGFVLRPELWDFFAWMKKLAKTVNLWTLSDRDYANWVKEIIEEKMGEGFITNVWCDEDDALAKEHANPAKKIQKNLNWLWDQGIFKPCDTILIDDYEANIKNEANYRNGIQIRKFALWSRVTKSDPFGPYRDMSKDRALLDVVDEIKKIDQSKLCEGDSRPIEKAVLRVSVPGGRRRRTRKLKPCVRRRCGTARKSGGGRS
jgi:hypothetical protein